MIEDHDDNSPRYFETQNRVLQILKKSRKWMSIGEIVRQLSDTAFLSDSLNALVFGEHIKQGGGVLIPKYKYTKPVKKATPARVCTKCKQPKALVEFEREWSGRPAKTCKACREQSLRNLNKRRKKVNGNPSGTDEPRQ
jgi:hypothetical protein